MRSSYSGMRKCPRCGGNIFLDRDFSSWYVECLQCSFSKDLDISSVAGQRRIS